MKPFEIFIHGRAGRARLGAGSLAALDAVIFTPEATDAQPGKPARRSLA
jgi:hypothetical protein